MKPKDALTTFAGTLKDLGAADSTLSHGAGVRLYL
ncbi:Uncharacterised protein [Klebsiella pneumoniae]|uniref:Uncharacterized protein n=1 Tax=Klebsiella pneumoniae TaxID=573 RepID=A0A378FU92_KLEPN|nr:Uncharacterised protein [Klebsiella pneumoniae]